MNDIQKQKFTTAYEQALYEVLLPNGTLRFRIGEYDAATEQQLLAAVEVKREWFIITPCNPRSEPAREKLNLYYFDELRYALDETAGNWIKALNRDPSGQWPDEPGFLVVDPDRAWIMDLGRRFMQNALVTAAIGEAPRLVWLNG